MTHRKIWTNASKNAKNTKIADSAPMFKQCNVCKTRWESREEFLEDPDIDTIGYQVNFEELSAGMFLFNHSCGTTLALKAEDFLDLYDGPIFTEKAAGTEQCPGYCLYRKRLDSCPVKCECAYVREIIQIIRKWDKKSGQPPVPPAER